MEFGSFILKAHSFILLQYFYFCRASYWDWSMIWVRTFILIFIYLYFLFTENPKKKKDYLHFLRCRNNQSLRVGNSELDWESVQYKIMQVIKAFLFFFCVCENGLGPNKQAKLVFFLFFFY